MSEQILGCFRRESLYALITQPSTKFCVECSYEPRSKECIKYTNEYKRFLFV